MPDASTPPPAPRPGLLAVAALLTSAALCLGATAQDDWAWAPDQPGGYASTTVIIKLTEGLRPAFDRGRWTVERIPAAAEPAGLQVQPDQAAATREIGDFERELQRFGATAISTGVDHVPDNPTARRVGLDRYYIVHLPEGTDTPALVDTLGRMGRVLEHAELDGIGGIAGGVMPDDEHFDLLYGLLNVGQNIAGGPGTPGADIKATEAWALTTGSTDMVLGVLDAGIDAHEDNDGRLVPGWAFDGGDPGDVCVSHGTHVAGTAGANADNGIGTAGVNWGIKLKSYRVLASCNGSESDVALGVMAAYVQGVDIINMSLQFSGGTQFFHDAILTAYDDGNGIPMIAASGNNGFSGGVAYPGRWPETITVAATNKDDQRASFSNQGPEVDVAAPGDDVYSLTGTSSYGYKDGTSMATPHVAGLVGLMLTLDPDLTIEEIRTILRETADDVEEAGFDEKTGWGRVNALAALQAIGIHGDVNGDGEVDVLDLVALILAWGPCGDPCPEDLNHDGEVDVLDLIDLILNFG